MSVIRFACSVSPEVTQPEEAGGHQEFTTLHEDIRKTLGGNGSITWAETIPDSTWAGGTHTEELAAVLDSGGLVTAACDLLFIKHSGFQDVAHTTVSTDNLTIDSQEAASGVAKYFTLGPGEAMYIPRPNVAFYLHASANTVSVEWAELT